MRCVADFDTENHALKFWGFLKQKGIDSSLEKGDGESNVSCQIWVLDEDQLSLAFSYLNEFKSNPDDPKFSTASKKDKMKKPPLRNEASRNSTCGKNGKRPIVPPAL